MPNVRNLRGFLLLAAITIAVFGAGSVPAWAQITQISTVVDENGHRTINGFLGLQPLPFSIIPDPGPGGKPNVLAYGLLNPPGLVTGDVDLIVTFAGGGFVSDTLRFDAVTGGGTLFFYSDQDGGIDAIADIVTPFGHYPNFIDLHQETVGPGLFGAIYTPTTGQPGFVAGAPVPVTYTFISEMPEPASLFLLLTGGATLLGLGVLRGRT